MSNTTPTPTPGDVKKEAQKGQPQPKIDPSLVRIQQLASMIGNDNSETRIGICHK